MGLWESETGSADYASFWAADSRCVLSVARTHRSACVEVSVAISLEPYGSQPPELTMECCGRWSMCCSPVRFLRARLHPGGRLTGSAGLVQGHLACVEKR